MQKMLKISALLLFASAALWPAGADARCPGLKAMDGKCADPLVVEDAQLRAMVMTTVRSSYFGTPIGTVGGAYIPFERLFRDDPVVFGLPTHKLFVNPAGDPPDIGIRYTK